MQVHGLEDLHLPGEPGKRLVVLGDPVVHSLSPAMHNAALRAMADRHPELSGWTYEAVHVPAESLAQALQLLHQAGVAGINLTLPHKVRALDLVESVDVAVRPMGAVNTLIRTGTGYRATNTDGYGILKALEEAFAIDVKGREIWLFGAGGAARGIIVACLKAGCQRLTVVNRSESRLFELEEQVKSALPEDWERTRFCSTATAPHETVPGSILVNATSLGLKAEDPCPIPEPYLDPAVFVYDTTYGVVNQLGRKCRDRGIPYADGLSMLVWQGVRSLEIWTGHPVPAAVMRKAAEEQLRERTTDG
jgi:shikimate dehydrogenase